LAAIYSVILNDVKDLGAPRRGRFRFSARRRLPYLLTTGVIAVSEIRKALRALIGAGPFGALRDPSRRPLRMTESMAAN